MGMMGFLGIVVVYTMRACLSVAITEMVAPLNNMKNGSDSVICHTDSSAVENGDVVVPVSSLKIRNFGEGNNDLRKTKIHNQTIFIR